MEVVRTCSDTHKHTHTHTHTNTKTNTNVHALTHTYTYAYTYTHTHTHTRTHTWPFSLKDRVSVWVMTDDSNLFSLIPSQSVYVLFPLSLSLFEIHVYR